MKERPILFRGPMVRAILDGRKTQTRRVAKGVQVVSAAGEALKFLDSCAPRIPCPYGHPGDRLWVRESWSTHSWFDDVPPSKLTTRSINYLANGRIKTGKGRPSIHMPRWASRILLEITSISVEHLNAGEGETAFESRYLSEGIHRIDHGRGDYYHSAFRDEPHPNNWTDPADAFKELWESINGAGSWDENPLVWVIKFQRIEEAGQ